MKLYALVSEVEECSLRQQFSWRLAIAARLHAMASDEYGMSQRGGSVISLIKIGEFRSPLVGREDTILLAFEESEFYRNLGFLKEGGKAVVNTGRQAMQDSVSRLCSERNITVHLVDADGIALKKRDDPGVEHGDARFFCHSGSRALYDEKA